jgi:hypothetical protein
MIPPSEEDEMNDHDNLKQKLFEALHDLFSEKGLAAGLIYAGVYLHQVHDVPSEFKTEFEEIKAALTTFSSVTEASGGLPEVSPQEAVIMARRTPRLWAVFSGPSK